MSFAEQGNGNNHYGSNDLSRWRENTLSLLDSNQKVDKERIHVV